LTLPKPDRIKKLAQCHQASSSKSAWFAAGMKCHVALQRHKGISKKIEIPRSIPGLVTRRLLVMNFLDGLQITRLGDKTKKLSHKKRKIAVEGLCIGWQRHTAASCCMEASSKLMAIRATFWS